MSIQSFWLTRGYFDFSKDGQPHITQRVRDELCTALGRPRGGLSIASYPVGPAWRHTFWWREGDCDYAEAQFFLQISRDYPVLSLGVSVEKGFEDTDRSVSKTERLDRSSWDWQHLVDSAELLFGAEAPRIAEQLGMPLAIRFRTHQRQGAAPERRSFTLENRAWFERWVGQVEARTLTDHVIKLDQLYDRWVIAHFAVDLSPALAGEMSTTEITKLLLHFNPLRERLRGRS